MVDKAEEGSNIQGRWLEKYKRFLKTETHEIDAVERSGWKTGAFIH